MNHRSSMTLTGFLAFLDFHSLGILVSVIIGAAICWVIAEEMNL